MIRIILGLPVTQKVIVAFQKWYIYHEYDDRSFLIIFDNRLKLSIFITIYPFKKEQLRPKFNGNEQA